MEFLDNPDRIKLAFGIPFFSMDFNELMLTIGELVPEKKKSHIFAASMPWLLDYAKYPLLFPVDANLILAADSTLINMADKAGIKMKMPLEYFEFPEQIARICAHYGYSLMHISETPLKTDILIRDGYVPLSWDLFTHFKTTGILDEIDVRSIIASANDSKPDIVLISAPPENLHNQLAEIYEGLHDSLLICIPQDVDRNKFEEKIDNILSPLVLLQEELKFIKHLQKTTALALPSSLGYEIIENQAVVKIAGTLDRETVQDLVCMSIEILDQELSMNLDLADTHAISLKGLEVIHYLCRKFFESGQDFSISNLTDDNLNAFHRSGLNRSSIKLPGIIDDLDE